MVRKGKTRFLKATHESRCRLNLLMCVMSSTKACGSWACRMVWALQNLRRVRHIVASGTSATGTGISRSLFPSLSFPEPQPLFPHSLLPIADRPCCDFVRLRHFLGKGQLSHLLLDTPNALRYGMYFYSQHDDEPHKEYIGQWRNDHFYGIGKRLSKDGTMYLGNWKKGLRHGDGIARVAHASVLDPVGFCLSPVARELSTLSVSSIDVSLGAVS